MKGSHYIITNPFEPEGVIVICALDEIGQGMKAYRAAYPDMLAPVNVKLVEGVTPDGAGPEFMLSGFARCYRENNTDHPKEKFLIVLDSRVTRLGAATEAESTFWTEYRGQVLTSLFHEPVPDVLAEVIRTYLVILAATEKYENLSDALRKRVVDETKRIEFLRDALANYMMDLKDQLGPAEVGAAYAQGIERQRDERRELVEDLCVSPGVLSRIAYISLAGGYRIGLGNLGIRTLPSASIPVPESTSPTKRSKNDQE